jgi:hypothetical protein
MGKKSKKTKKKKTDKPGPKAQVLKLSENWKKAIKKTFLKEKPPEGWPK